MISDVLSEAVDQIDKYLDSHTYDDMYPGRLRAEVVAVRTIMDSLRRKLDMPPDLSAVRKFRIVFLDGHVVEQTAEKFSSACVLAAHSRLQKGYTSAKQLRINEKACSAI